MAIYESGTGGSPITLPRSWNAVDFSETSTLYVGATPFTSGAAAQDGTLTLTYKRPLQTGPTDFDIQDSVRVLLLPVEIKATSHGLPPAGSIGKYNKDPDVGSVDNLIAVWPAEELVLTVELPEPFKSNPPAGLITWTAPSHTVPDRTTEFTFTWLDTGVKTITINIGGTPFKVVVDVPNVGNTSEGDAYAAVDPISGASIFLYGAAAVSYTELHYGNVPRKDAMRHSYWNAQCVSDALVSNQATIFVTTAHEYGNKWSTHDQAFNTTMDLHNNAVGRATVHSHLGFPDQQAILADLTQKYAAGVLWIWDGERPQGDSEGILSKSDRTKIFPP